MLKSLLPEQVERYERDGVLFPIPILSDDEVLTFRAAFEQLEAQLGGNQRYVPWTHLYFRWAYDLATHPLLLDAAEDILGPDILIYGTLILCKYPQDSSRVDWHQDGSHSASAWIALSHSSAESGCMRVIPSSHRNGRFPHAKSHSEDNVVTQELQIDVDESLAEDVVLRAGEVSLHHNNIIHGSRPNRSGAKRIGFIVRFITPKFEKSAGPIIAARGQAGCHLLNLLDQPPTAGIEENISAWREFIKKY